MERLIINGVPMAIPGRYSMEIAVCEQMGWTYADLMSTPADMVDEIVVRMSAQGNAERIRHRIEASKGKR